MSIEKSFEKAFARMEDQKWDKIYVLVDIHDTVFESDYSKTYEFKWIGESKTALHMLSDRHDVCLILWSGTHRKEIADHYELEFVKNGIYFEYINENPEVGDTEIYSKDKIYFNVGIDDKFGFEPETDWKKIVNFLKSR